MFILGTHTGCFMNNPQIRSELKVKLATVLWGFSPENRQALNLYCAYRCAHVGKIKVGVAEVPLL